MRPLTDCMRLRGAQDAPTSKTPRSPPLMFLSAIVKAHSDGLVDDADLANLSVDLDDVAAAPIAPRTSDDVNADAIAALERRLIELPAIHRARWL